jgi:hypothetical protein
MLFSRGAPARGERICPLHGLLEFLGSPERHLLATLELRIGEAAVRHHRSEFGEMPLVKITLPIHEATAALALCDLYGITGATIYPDYYGAARAARDVMLATWRIED